MTTHPRCQARLPLGAKPVQLPNTEDWPRFAPQRLCTQRVGVLSWFDVLNVRRAACSLPGHLADVAAQSRAAEMIERVRHETRPEPPAPPITAKDWQPIRPEIARSLR